jgi:hypothetical protein
LADWATISAIATAGGTLVLAVATYSSVRSANRSARIAERTLLLGLRPVLITSRSSDPAQLVRWGDGYEVTLGGGAGHLEEQGGVTYLAMALRNVGAGLGVLQAWHLTTRPLRATDDHPPVEEFRRQQRDLYIAAGDTGFWQAALRDPDDAFRGETAEALAQERAVLVHLLYGDHEGGQLTISRFRILRREGEQTIAEVARHWSLEAPDPRLSAG